MIVSILAVLKCNLIRNGITKSANTDMLERLFPAVLLCMCAFPCLPQTTSAQNTSGQLITQPLPPIPGIIEVHGRLHIYPLPPSVSSCTLPAPPAAAGPPSCVVQAVNGTLARLRASAP